MSQPPRATQTGSVQVSPQDAQAIVNGDYQRLVQLAEHLGPQLKQRKLQTSQIRRFFGEVRRIDLAWQEGQPVPGPVYLLKPKLAYQERRNIAGAADLLRALVPVLDAVVQGPPDAARGRFKRFVEFFEAILAYHGGD